MTFKEKIPSDFLSKLNLSNQPGNPLPSKLKSLMEAVFHFDLSNIRFLEHEAVSLLGAEAIALGSSICFAPGRFQPDSLSGICVIGHEIAHCVQQHQGRVSSNTDQLEIIHDETLETEANLMGELAGLTYLNNVQHNNESYSLLFTEPASQQSTNIQCLMTVKHLQEATNDGKRRKKIARVESALQAYHEALKVQPPNNTKAIQLIGDLYKACTTYTNSANSGDRVHVVKMLAREAALEEVVLVKMQAGFRAGSAIDRYNAFDAALTALNKITTLRPDPAAKHSIGGTTYLQNQLSATKDLIRDQGLTEQVIRADIAKLRKIAQSPSTPQAIKRFLTEITADANIAVLNKMMDFTPGITIKLQLGKDPVHILKHPIVDIEFYGEAFRLGQISHELTHLSNYQIFKNTHMQFAMPPGDSDDQWMTVVRQRKAELAKIAKAIENDHELLQMDPAGRYKKMFTLKVGYPTCGKLAMYLATFKTTLDAHYPGSYARLKGLQAKGMDCELIEYDSVINQMTMWCYNLRLSPSNALYTQLRASADAAYIRRMHYA